MKALIIGAGAVGVAIAASVSNENMETALVARGRTADYIEKNGVKRTGIFGVMSAPADKVRVYRDYGQIKEAYDYVIISAKTLANSEIADNLEKNRGIIADDGHIVIFQNGWGNDDKYTELFGKDKVYNARIITGFEKENPGTSKVTVHTAPILLGSLFGFDNECMKPLADAINASGIPSEVSDTIEEALWAKMLFNTTLNPLGAILGTTYGAMSEMNNAVQIMNSLIGETYNVMGAAGYKTYWPDADTYKKVFYSKLVPDTYAHRSSTLQDMEKGIPTEIDTLNGCVIRIADNYSVEVPVHRTIYNIIKSMEQRNK